MKPSEGMLRIVLDAMGGDHATFEIVKGGVDALKEIPNIEITMVGDVELIEKDLEKLGELDNLKIKLVHAEDQISMDDIPFVALRSKKKSSIHIGCDLVKEAKADAFISAGNTGAVMAVATVKLRTLEGIDRAGIAAAVGNKEGGRTVLIDVGANLNLRPGNLYQFGVMGSIYHQCLYPDSKHPRVGILSIGEEETKGNVLTRDASELLAKSSLNFIGNVEAKLLYNGVADVIISDGFSGNIAIKVSSSMAYLLLGRMKEIFSSSLRGKLAYLLIRKDLPKIRLGIDHVEIGGAPLLGVNGAVFIAHGSSKALSITNGIRSTVRFLEAKVNERISQAIRDDIAIHKTKSGMITDEAGKVWKKLKDIVFRDKEDENLKGEKQS